MDTKKIVSLCKKLDDARSSLAEAVQCRKTLNFGGHQEGVIAVVGKTQISVSDLSRSTGYASKVIRGREMIVLGMQKVANANIEYWQHQVADISAQIAKAAGEQQ